MKYINIVLCVLMIYFFVVQYNDPDGLLWALIYIVPAIWAGLAAWRPVRFSEMPAIGLLACSLYGALFLTIYYWPATPNFWLKEVWWETETAREGMGMMIVSVVILIAAYTIWSSRVDQHEEG